MTSRQLKTITQPQTTSESAQNWLISIIQGWGLVIITLHLAAPHLPEEMAWSLWPYTLLRPWLGWGLALIVGALVITPINDLVLTILLRFWNHLLRVTGNASRLTIQASHFTSNRQAGFVLLALLAGLLFWLARLRHLRWGDSYLLSVALSYPDLELRVIYNWQAPLTVLLHQRLWQFVANPLLGWPVERVYAVVSIICGVIFVYVLLNFVTRLGRNALEAVVLAGLVLTTGSIQLFFGYVENYTVLSLGLMVTMFLAWRALHGEIEPVWPVLGLSLTNGFHPSTVFIWPGMWLLVGLCWRREYVSLAQALWQMLLPPLLVAGTILGLLESGHHGLSAFVGVDRPGGGDGIWFVPLFETTTKWQQYTLFSVAHLLDWSNLHLLVSPFGIPLVLTAVVAAARFRGSLFDSAADRDYAYFLGVTSAMYLLFTWLWNPDYGGRKDWDLFAPSAFIYTLLAGFLLVRVLTNRWRLSAAGLFVIAVSLLHTGAWIFANTHQLPVE